MDLINDIGMLTAHRFMYFHKLYVQLRILAWLNIYVRLNLFEPMSVKKKKTILHLYVNIVHNAKEILLFCTAIPLTRRAVLVLLI